MRLPSRSAVTLLVFAVIAACVPGPKAPDVAATRSLELQDEARTKASSRPFGVVSAAPQGETLETAEVAVVLDRPLRALETEGDELPVPARIEAAAGGAPKGRWQWMGTQAFVYVPEGHLPAASQFRVTVPAGTRALDGSTLHAAYTFSFSTPRPAVTFEPQGNAQRLGPSSTVRIHTNQPVDLREIERTTSFVSKAKKGAIGVKASYAPAPKTTAASVAVLGQPPGTLADTFELRPVAPLPLATDFDLRVSAGLRGSQGPLPMAADASFPVATYGALTVKAISCDVGSDAAARCRPSGGVRVELSNRVPYKDLRAAITANGKPMPKGSDDETESIADFWVPGPLPPGGTVTVNVRPGLRDEFGQTLGAGRSVTLRVGDLPSQLELGVAGHVFERKRPGSSRTITVRTVNLDSYELAVASLGEEQTVAFIQADSTGVGAAWASLPPNETKLRVVRPQVGRNRAALETVSLDAALGKQNGAGVVVIASSATYEGYGDKQTIPTAEVYRVTDLAVSAKVSRYGGVVWVTRLSDAQPAAGAAVRIRHAKTGAVVFQATTDAGGLVDVPPEILFQPNAGLAVAIAALGDDWTYRVLDEPNNTNVYPDPARGLSTVGMLFTDRGLYRRGESVHVKTLFRQEQLAGLGNPAGKPVTLTATDAGGTVIFERGAALGAFGEAAFEIPVGESAPLGSLSLRAMLDAREEAGAAYESVQIAAYRPAEFKASASFAKPTHVRGDKTSCTARGEYLFGAPMSQGSARFTLSRRTTWFTPPGSEERVVDDGAFGRDAHAASASYSLISGGGQTAPGDTGQKPLGARGEATLDFSLVLPGQQGPETVSCEADLTDVSRQSIAAETTTLVHPGTFYVALDAPDDRFLAERATLTPNVRAVEPDGRVRAGVAVKLELIKRSWSSVYEEQGESGGHWTTQVKDVLVKSCDTRTAASAAGCALGVEGPGYYVVHATATDERKNPLGASYGVYVSGESGGAGWPMRDDASLELETDRASYEVGQTAKILVKNPYVEADALVTVERASTLQKFRVHVKGPAPLISVPIGADVRPNAYVTVELIRGRIREGEAPAPVAKPGVLTKRKKEAPRAVDLGGPAYRIGTASLVVNPASRRLQVALKSPKTQYGPGEQLDVDVSVRDAAGKGAETDVTFYVVDEGVLMLSGYKTPDPVPTFTAGLPLRVASYETRAELARLLVLRGQLGADKGIEGGGGGDGVRADFRTTAVFTSLKTDAQGHAHVRTKLPEGLTTYRVMAVVAGRDDRFGFGESRITTSRPLMIRPALPRFLRAGDRIDAGAILTAKGLPAGPVRVSIAATGALIEGGAEQTVNLPKEGSAEVRFALRTDHVGAATFTFRAEGMGQKDAAVFTKKVQIPTIYETVALSGETERAVAEKLGDLSAIRSDSGGLTVRLASTALVGVESVVDQLTDYPHGCTEQLSSRLLPLIESKELSSFFGFAVESRPDKLADAVIAQILERQHSDGGFGYWSSSAESDPWLSTYATMVLGRAASAGRPVPPQALVRAVSYVRQWVGGAANGRAYQAGSWAQRAFAVDVLATLGELPAPSLRKKGAAPKPGPSTGGPPLAEVGLAGAIHALLPPPADAPLFARALLTHAVAAAKLRREDQLELARDLEKYVRLTPTGSIVTQEQSRVDRELRQRLLDSDLRTTAMVLRALVAVDPAHPLAPKLAKGILASRRNGTYQSTQEAAWVLVALDDYRKAYETAAPAFDARLFLGGTLAHEAGFQGATVRAQTTELPMAKLFAGEAGGAAMAFQVVGQGTLFYEARLRYARKVNPTTALARGFAVQKWLRAVTPETLDAAAATFPQTSATEVQAGALVLVDLLVVNDVPQFQVVLDDPLPAGLEAVNGDLVGAARSIGAALENAEERDDGDEGFSYRRAPSFERKVDDDRVLTYVEDLPAGLHHYRYVARATTRGSFVVPPARVECMYEPEIFGRTPGFTFTVR